jgi:hypothetical protein
MSLYTLRSGIDNHPEDSVLQAFTDMIRTGGVLNPTTDFYVSEPSGGGRNVDITTGRAFVKSTTSNCYPVRNTAKITKAINANSSGNPRITSIVLYCDLVSTPAPTGGGNDVAKIIAVDGTASSSPIAPSDATIQSAIGASDPFIRLANVTVASGATGISNANISNTAPRVFIQSKRPVYPLTNASTITPDYLNSDIQLVTIAQDTAIGEPTNMIIGDSLELIIIQNGTGGWDLTWFGDAVSLSGDMTTAQNPADTTTYVIQRISTDIYHTYLVGKKY